MSEFKILRIEINDEPWRWMPRSLAMAVGLADHIWTIVDLLGYVPLSTNRL